MARWSTLLVSWLVASCGDSPAPTGPTFDADLFRDAAGADAARDAELRDVGEPTDGSGPDDAEPPRDGGGGDRDASTVVACETPRVCPGPAAGTGALFSLALGAEIEDGNVLLHAGIATPRGPVIPWSSRLCCGADPKPMSAGVARLGDDARVVHLFGPVLEPLLEASPAVVAMGTSLWVLDPLGGFARAAELDADTLAPIGERDPGFGAGGVATPAVAVLGSGDTVALVSTETTTELRLLGSDGALVASIDLERTTARVGLTATCDGLLATWEEGRRAMAMQIAPDGMPVGEPREYGETGLETELGHRGVVFDGAHVVTVGPRHVYELAPDGSLASATISLLAPLAAVGTDEGVVVLQREATEGEGAPVVLLERETGAVLRELARVDTGTLYASDGTVVVAPGHEGAPASIHLAAASYTRRSQIVGARIDCR